MYIFGSLGLIYHGCLFLGTWNSDVNHSRHIREEYLTKEHCGRSGIMGYVTFHHKTRRGPLAVA